VRGSVPEFRGRMSTAMSEVRIAAEPRTEFGKGGARRTRRAGKVPAVLYGHGQPPRHIALPARELLHAFKTDAGTNVLLTVELSDGAQLALPKDIQRHPIRGSFEHVDLVVVRRGERVTVDVPVVLTGEADRDGIVDQQATTVSLQADAAYIPSSLELDITGLSVGASLTGAALTLPEGAVLISGSDLLVVQVLAKPTAASEELPETGETETAEASA
jgi:large subunit ribosomal protein L25